MTLEESSGAVPSTEVSGYHFVCAEDRACLTCYHRAVAFSTSDLEEAYKHSFENNVGMWVVKNE